MTPSQQRRFTSGHDDETAMLMVAKDGRSLLNGRGSFHAIDSAADAALKFYKGSGRPKALRQMTNCG